MFTEFCSQKALVLFHHFFVVFLLFVLTIIYFLTVSIIMFSCLHIQFTFVLFILTEYKSRIGNYFIYCSISIYLLYNENCMFYSFLDPCLLPSSNVLIVLIPDFFCNDRPKNKVKTKKVYLYSKQRLVRKELMGGAKTSNRGVDTS